MIVFNSLALFLIFLIFSCKPRLVEEDAQLSAWATADNTELEKIQQLTLREFNSAYTSVSVQNKYSRQPWKDYVANKSGIPHALDWLDCGPNENIHFRQHPILYNFEKYQLRLERIIISRDEVYASVTMDWSLSGFCYEYFNKKTNTKEKRNHCQDHITLQSKGSYLDMVFRRKGAPIFIDTSGNKAHFEQLQNPKVKPVHRSDLWEDDGYWMMKSTNDVGLVTPLRGGSITMEADTTNCSRPVGDPFGFTRFGSHQFQAMYRQSNAKIYSSIGNMINASFCKAINETIDGINLKCNGLERGTWWSGVAYGKFH